MYYTYDLTDLTPEEQVKAKEISELSFKKRQELYEKQTAAIEAGEDHTQIDTELTDYMYNDPYLKYLEELERRHFALLGGDLTAIYNDALERLPRLIIRDVNGIMARLEAENSDDAALLKPEAIRGRIRYHLTMHLEALRADPELYDSLTAEISQYAKKAEKLAKDRGQIPGQLSLFDIPDPSQPKTKGYKNAEAQGAITTLNGYLPMISNSMYQYALTSNPNEYAYIVNAESDLMREIISESLDNPDGQLDIAENNLEKLAYKEAVKPIDTSLLSAFFKALQLSYVNKSADNLIVSVYLPKFCQELGVRLNKLDPETAQKMGLDFDGDPDGSDAQEPIVEDRKKNSNDFWARMDAIESYIGILNNSSYVYVCRILEFHQETKILELAFPYFRHLIQILGPAPDVRIDKKTTPGTPRIEQRNYVTLAHSDIVNERNQVAVSIVTEILTRIFQRGNQPDAKKPQNKYKNYSTSARKTVTTTIYCADIVENIPDFKYRLDNMQSNATEQGKIEKSILDQQNKALKRAFVRAYELLDEKTDAYSYFSHLEITPVIPTMRTLENLEITITHQGVNPNYKKGKYLQKKQQKKKSDRMKKTLNKGT